MKKCNKCNLEKLDEKFDFKDKRKIERKATCRKCRYERWKSLNPERERSKGRNKHLKKYLKNGMIN